MRCKGASGARACGIDLNIRNTMGCHDLLGTPIATLIVQPSPCASVAVRKGRTAYVSYYYNGSWGPALPLRSMPLTNGPMGLWDPFGIPDQPGVY